MGVDSGRRGFWWTWILVDVDSSRRGFCRVFHRDVPAVTGPVPLY